MRLVIFFLFSFIIPSFAKKLPDIYWNSTNPLVERYAAIKDMLDIHCPYFEEGIDPVETEQTVIYRVPEEDYEKCRLSSRAQLLGKCSNPYKKLKITTSFRQTSPNPSALLYEPGRTYYFISTSTGSIKGLENDIGGLCASHNLKMVIHVTDKYGDIAGLSHHRHRHHHSRPTPTAAPIQSEPQWPETPLWGQFLEKVANDAVWPHHEPSRAERVSLDGHAEKPSDSYLAMPLENDFLDFQIHEIGEVESLFSSSTRHYRWLSFVLPLLLIALL